jgi:3-phenylpropionate/trans-cinnamate dioxygenase ferredoxin reductase subunit
VSLRQWGFSGTITLVGEEASLPYQRPPLSKAYLKGELQGDRLLLKHLNWYEDNNIDLVLGSRATSIDRETRCVLLEHGATLPYDVVILATGSRARTLPMDGAKSSNVFALRSLADVESIKPRVIAGHKLVIVGAGYIGLEAASAARTMGMDVTVLEYAPRVLERVTSPVISAFYEKVHRERGVRILTDARLRELALQGDAVSGVVLENGETIAADMILIGIGIEPNIELADECGIHCDNGVVVDHDARTNDARIFAAGDCANRPLVHYNERRSRLESVHNAIEQGKQAAAAIVGRPRAPEDCPWFWSDQYDIKLQIAGLSSGYDRLLTRGDPDSNRFAVFYFAGDCLLATDAVNSPQEFLMSKRLIINGLPVDAEQIADPQVPMKTIVENSLAR